METLQEHRTCKKANSDSQLRKVQTRQLRVQLRGQFHQHVYAQLLFPQIPKAHKAFFALLGSACVKAARKM